MKALFITLALILVASTQAQEVSTLPDSVLEAFPALYAETEISHAQTEPTPLTTLPTEVFNAFPSLYAETTPSHEGESASSPVVTEPPVNPADVEILDNPVYVSSDATEPANSVDVEILHNPVYDSEEVTILENPSYEFSYNPATSPNADLVILEDPVFDSTSVSSYIPGSTFPNVQPALVGGFSAPGLKKIVDSILPVVLSKVKGMRIPGVSGGANGFAYSVTDIVVNQISMGGITSAVKNGLDLGLNGVAVQVSARFSFKKTGFPWFPWGSGTLNVGVSGSSIGALFAVGTQQTAEGLKPQIRASQVHVNLQDISIKVGGSFFSWLYNIFIGLFKGSIKNSITNTVRDTFSQAINVASDQITRTMPTLSPVSNFGVIDMSLTNGANYFNDQQMVALSFNGEIYPLATKKSDGVVPRRAFTYAPTGRMLDLYMSDFVINTACHSFIVQGSNTLKVNKETSKAFPVDFTTNAWAKMLPKTTIGSVHADKLVDIELLTATSDKRVAEPRVKAVGERLELTTEYLANVYALLNGARSLLFTTRLSLGGALTLRVENRNTPVFIPQVPRFDFKAEVIDTKIGPVPVADIANVVTAMVNAFILPDLNAKLLAGIPLPSVQGLAFTNTLIQVKTGYLVIASDVTYTPPPMLMTAFESMTVTNIDHVNSNSNSNSNNEETSTTMVTISQPVPETTLESQMNTAN